MQMVFHQYVYGVYGYSMSVGWAMSYHRIGIYSDLHDAACGPSVFSLMDKIVSNVYTGKSNLQIETR